jgi:hypothetical protein
MTYQSVSAMTAAAIPAPNSMALEIESRRR